jgi:hypothetical protein
LRAAQKLPLTPTYLHTCFTRQNVKFYLWQTSNLPPSSIFIRKSFMKIQYNVLLSTLESVQKYAESFGSTIKLNLYHSNLSIAGRRCFNKHRKTWFNLSLILIRAIYEIPPLSPVPIKCGGKRLFNSQATFFSQTFAVIFAFHRSIFV